MASWKYVKKIQNCQQDDLNTLKNRKFPSKIIWLVGSSSWDFELNKEMPKVLAGNNFAELFN